MVLLGFVVPAVEHVRRLINWGIISVWQLILYSQSRKFRCYICRYYYISFIYDFIYFILYIYSIFYHVYSIFYILRLSIFIYSIFRGEQEFEIFCRRSIQLFKDSGF